MTGLAAVALLVTGCSGERDLTVTEKQDVVLDALAQELSQLVDERGLVINPPSERPRPVDPYATAWLVTMADEAGVELPGAPSVAAVVDDPDVAASLRDAVPAEWWAWSLETIAAAGGETLADDDVVVPASTYADAQDDDDRAARTWIASVLEDAGRPSGYPGALADDLVAATADGRVSAIRAWFLVDACARLDADCRTPRVEPVTTTIREPLDVLTLAAAASLARAGVDVDGYDGEAARELAEEALTGLEPGNDVLAAKLAGIVAAEGGDRAPAAAYLDEAAERWDADAGMYRQHVVLMGSVEATYAARRILGERFVALAEEHGTYGTVEGLLGRPGTLGVVPELMALAILQDRDGGVPDAFAGRAAEVSADYSGRTVPATDAGLALQVAALLLDLGEPVTDLEVEPVPVTEEDERLVNHLVAAALDGTLANGEELLAAYADHVDALPRVVVADGPGHPNFHTRLGVLDYLDPGWTEESRQALVDQTRTRVGCAATPHLVTRTTDPLDGCDVLLTADVVHSSVGIDALAEAS
ncbi:hypothetical protein [Cellulomonas carbonis]|nr:hypothetical protein [Cellulomonas carbonis]GGC00456.1 hypothetical protein GCM10010972_11520 [Cellulomonas carbonis]